MSEVCALMTSGMAILAVCGIALIYDKLHQMMVDIEEILEELKEKKNE